jgi:ABC-type phosphate transport system substrate-binding protein
MGRIAVAALLISAVSGIAGAPAEDPAFVVVVAAANPATAIQRQDLARIFLKKTSRWSDGRTAVPVDQSVGTPVRDAFTRSVLAVEGMGQISSVQNFWLQQVYSGRNTPPAVKAGDAEVLAFVEANPGAVGYVSTSPARGSVKILAIRD